MIKRNRGSILTREEITQRVENRRDEVLSLSLKNGTPTAILAKSLRVDKGTIAHDIRALKAEGRLPHDFRPQGLIRKRFVLTEETHYLLCNCLRRGMNFKKIAEELDVGVQTLSKRLKSTGDPKILDALRINKKRRQPKPKKQKTISISEKTKAKVDEWAESLGKTIEEINDERRVWMMANGYFKKPPKSNYNPASGTSMKPKVEYVPPDWLKEWQKKQ